MHMSRIHPISESNGAWNDHVNLTLAVGYKFWNVIASPDAFVRPFGGYNMSFPMVPLYV
jgi:hypothetical protein